MKFKRKICKEYDKLALPSPWIDLYLINIKLYRMKRSKDVIPGCREDLFFEIVEAFSSGKFAHIEKRDIFVYEKSS